MVQKAEGAAAPDLLLLVFVRLPYQNEAPSLR